MTSKHSSMKKAKDSSAPEDAAVQGRSPKTAKPRRVRKAKAAPRRTGRSVRGWLRRVVKWAMVGAGAFVLTTVMLAAMYRFVNPPITPIMLINYVGAEEGKARMIKHWRSYEALPPKALLAIIAAEDQRFPEHYGFDAAAIRKAIQEHKDGERLRGGSTLSQQTAKNVFLWPGRSWLRKGLEAYFTVLVEALWGKRRILEVYANVVEFGPGIYGLEAAAQTYFHKEARGLNEQQAALLAAVLPSPRRYSPLRPTSFLRQRQAWIVRQMRNLGGVDYLDKL